VGNAPAAGRGACRLRWKTLAPHPVGRLTKTIRPSPPVREATTPGADEAVLEARDVGTAPEDKAWDPKDGAIRCRGVVHPVLEGGRPVCSRPMEGGATSGAGGRRTPFRKVTKTRTSSTGSTFPCFRKPRMDLGRVVLTAGVPDRESPLFFFSFPASIPQMLRHHARTKTGRRDKTLRGRRGSRAVVPSRSRPDPITAMRMEISLVRSAHMGRRFFRHWGGRGRFPLVHRFQTGPVHLPVPACPLL